MKLDLRAKGTSIVFGNNVNIGDAQIYAGDEPNLEISIGDNFLTSLECYIRVADGHTIIDLLSGEIINRPCKGIHIGNNVWCGYNVTILKDITISSNCVIGAGSIVTRSILENNTIIAGVPAKIVRHNVAWDSRSIEKYELAQHRTKKT